MNFDPENPSPIPDEDRLSPHRTIYLQLRQRIELHILQQTDPILALSEKPVGAFDWQPSSANAPLEQMDLIDDEWME
jgi:hypothetical protein